MVDLIWGDWLTSLLEAEFLSAMNFAGGESVRVATNTITI